MEKNENLASHEKMSMRMNDIIRDTKEQRHVNPSVHHQYSYEHHHYYPRYHATNSHVNYILDDVYYNRPRRIYVNAPDSYNFGSHPVNAFFMGSVTVMGLLLVYRMMEKMK